MKELELDILYVRGNNEYQIDVYYSGYNWTIYIKRLEFDDKGNIDSYDVIDVMKIPNYYNPVMVKEIIDSYYGFISQKTYLLQGIRSVN